MEEIWKDINEYEELYQVSNFGKIRSLERNITKINGITQHSKSRIIKGCDNGNGYLTVYLRKNGKNKPFYIHRLVAQAFIGNIDGKDINHKDFNRKNNRLDNLEILSRKENINYSIKHGKYEKLYSDRKNKTKEKYERIINLIVKNNDSNMPIYELEKKYNINHKTFSKYNYNERMIEIETNN